MREAYFRKSLESRLLEKETLLREWEARSNEQRSKAEQRLAADAAAAADFITLENVSQKVQDILSSPPVTAGPDGSELTKYNFPVDRFGKPLPHAARGAKITQFEDFSGGGDGDDPGSGDGYDADEQEDDTGVRLEEEFEELSDYKKEKSSGHYS